MLPDTDNGGATLLAQRLLDSVRALKIPHAMSSAGEHLTISAGVATLLPDSTSGIENLLNMADEQLYRAKHDGRNCARSAGLSD